MRGISFVVTALAICIVAGCQDGLVSTDATSALTATQQADELVLKREFGMIWADGELFRTLGTPATFRPGQGNFDKLYQGAFQDGVGAISEAKPGDQDFNGGRWEVWALKDGVTTDYSNANSVEDLDPNDFELTGTYFECPLLPARGNGHG